MKTSVIDIRNKLVIGLAVIERYIGRPGTFQPIFDMVLQRYPTSTCLCRGGMETIIATERYPHIPPDTTHIAITITSGMAIPCSMACRLSREGITLQRWALTHEGTTVQFHPQGHTDPFAYTVVSSTRRSPDMSLVDMVYTASTMIENRQIVPFTQIYTSSRYIHTILQASSSLRTLHSVLE